MDHQDCSMNSLTKMPRYPRGRILSYGLLLLVTIFSIGPLHAETPVSAAETGIRGKVMMGPTRPGPAVQGQEYEAPFSASFHVLDVDDKAVAHFESDENGCFTVLLPPGDYTIVPDASAPFPHTRRQRKTVTVPEDGFADVIFRFDTGMR
jgi:hypothetical protein